jgi:hypothetical protein
MNEIEDSDEHNFVTAAKKRVQNLHSIRKRLTERWQSAAESQAKHYNANRQFRSFNIGDEVPLSTKIPTSRGDNAKNFHISLRVHFAWQSLLAIGRIVCFYPRVGKFIVSSCFLLEAVQATARRQFHTGVECTGFH